MDKLDELEGSMISIENDKEETWNTSKKVQSIRKYYNNKPMYCHMYCSLKIRIIFIMHTYVNFEDIYYLLTRISNCWLWTEVYTSLKKYLINSDTLIETQKYEIQNRLGRMYNNIYIYIYIYIYMPVYQLQLIQTHTIILVQVADYFIYQ